MNGKAQSLVAAAMLALLGWIVAEQRAFQTQVNRDFAGVRSEIAALGNHMGGLEQRMARLEGLFEGHLNRDD